MINKQQARKVRHYRIRSKIMGTSERPRLNIFKSNNSFYAQIIDDTDSNTIIGVSTLTFKDLASKSNIDAATKLGETIANLAIKKKLKKWFLIVVDIYIMVKWKHSQKRRVVLD